MPGLPADSLEDVAWETETTPGLQQLAWVLAIQLQVLNGADDLGMHVSNHTKHTYPGWRGKKRGGGKGSRRREGRTKTQKKEGKEQKRQNIKPGVTERHCYHHLKRKHHCGYLRQEYTLQDG